MTMGVGNRKNLDFSRREALKLALAPLGAAAATGWLAGCATDGGSDARAQPNEDEDSTYQQVTGADAGARASSGDASAPVSVGDASSVDLTNVPWAKGGTKAMKGGYPDPFGTSGAGTMCELYPAMTLGPCYAQGPASREDITDGLPGLPLRLSFLVVRATGGCVPVANAEIDIWHTSAAGVYSAFASGVCNPNRAVQPAPKYCRGTRVTDANGRADFSSVFPGHYSGRSIHIHFTVRVGGRAYSTSQLFFEDALSDQIMATSEYSGRGRRATTNATDNILRGVDLKKVVMQNAKRSDGALHAWKVLSIRS
jgi:protocatechuate 3,4-dioxygenase beta subunit